MLETHTDALHGHTLVALLLVFCWFIVFAICRRTAVTTFAQYSMESCKNNRQAYKAEALFATITDNVMQFNERTNDRKKMQNNKKNGPITHTQTTHGD